MQTRWPTPRAPARPEVPGLDVRPHDGGARAGRIRGLDSIRAVCALWVVLGHIGGPSLDGAVEATSRVGRLARGLGNNLWNGPAAVIVFFVISGFCIHYPFARTLRIPSAPGYAARRYLRIGIPLAAAMILSPYLGIGLSLFHDSILWSLAAELIYYTIYPALLCLRRRGVGWGWMFAISFVAALGLAATRPGAGEYPSWGVGLNWLLGLPCWLLGCALAERIAGGQPGASGPIWGWRLAVWGTSVLLSVLRFHTPLGYPWTLNLFAILVVFWLDREIGRYQQREPAAWLERAGQWSYSLYLVHIPANVAFLAIAPLASPGRAIPWLARMGFILIASYLFHLCVERPGHIAARIAGRALGRR